MNKKKIEIILGGKKRIPFSIITISGATAAQLDAICFDRPWREDSYYQLETEPIYHLWGVSAENEARSIIAFLAFQQLFEDISILRIGVLPPYRQSGIARTLLKNLEEYAATQKVTRFVLEVNEYNTAALRLYHSVQFKEIHRRKKYYRKPTADALVLQKLIDPP